jgi:hypothetical protein
LQTGLKFPNGTVAAPAISFTNSVATGLYLATISDIRLSVGGVDVSRWQNGSFQVFSTGVWNEVAYQTAVDDKVVFHATSAEALAASQADSGYGLHTAPEGT